MCSLYSPIIISPLPLLNSFSFSFPPPSPPSFSLFPDQLPAKSSAACLFGPSPVKALRQVLRPLEALGEKQPQNRVVYSEVSHTSLRCFSCVLYILLFIFFRFHGLTFSSFFFFLSC